jgi:nicotinamide riboside kinase
MGIVHLCIVIRVAITGPECAGKTTLANDLLSQLPLAVMVEEQARFYLSQKPKGYAYDKADILAIAAAQLSALRKSDRSDAEFLIADTEFTVLDIWMKEVFRQDHPAIAGYFRDFRFDVFLLCKPDIPWEYDPLRENPNDRDRLFIRYEQALSLSQRPWHIMSGSRFERLEAALGIVQSLKTL